MDESWYRLYFTQSEKVFVVKPHDTAAFSRNINVSLERPDDWQQIISDKSLFDKYDIRHIDGSTATIPITAELCRQFCDAADNDLTFYIDHNTTGDAYENLRDGSYHLTSVYYAVTIKGGAPKAEAIKDYLISDEGQELIRYAGYCSIQ